eukprot:13995786-Alexandrium_andersonii.AAC.1
MSASLVGSEMCIRDSTGPLRASCAAAEPSLGAVSRELTKPRSETDAGRAHQTSRNERRVLLRATWMLT